MAKFIIFIFFFHLTGIHLFMLRSMHFIYFFKGEENTILSFYACDSWFQYKAKKKNKNNSWSWFTFLLIPLIVLKKSCIEKDCSNTIICWTLKALVFSFTFRVFDILILVACGYFYYYCWFILFFNTYPILLRTFLQFQYLL